MTTELRFLAATVILGLLHLIIDSHLISFQLGYRWTAGSREQPVPPLHGVANRVDQAYTNFMETFPFFVAVVLAAHLAGRHQVCVDLVGNDEHSLLARTSRLRFGRRSRLRANTLRYCHFFNTALSGIALFLITLLC